MTTQEILEAARAARSALALADGQTRTQALWGMADWLCHPDQMDAILAANAEDMAAAKGHISDVMLDRLALTPEPSAEPAPSASARISGVISSTSGTSWASGWVWGFAV